jgi:nucleoside-diphosphate-sugar epimerase
VNIIVTGAAGYIGSRLMAALLAGGHRITAIDKLIFGDDCIANFRNAIDLRVMDIRGVQPSHLANVDAVVHLAGLSNDPTAEFCPAANRSINLDATIRLGQMAKAAGARRFVFASTCSVYESSQHGDEFQDETTTVGPSAPYSWSKWQAETALLTMTSGNFNPIILRLGTVFGESPRMRYDLVVNTFARDAFRKHQLIVNAGGLMWRPLLHVDDAVAGIQLILSANEQAVGGQIFNLVGANYRICDLAHQVSQEYQRAFNSSIAVKVKQAGPLRSYRVNADRIHDAVGFVPTHDVASAVHTMWAALASRLDPESPIFHNISWFKMLIEMEQRLKRMGGSVY